MNEIYFIFVMFFALSLVVAASTRGLGMLQASAIFLSLSTSVMAGKIVPIFGFEVSVATCLYAAIFLVTDITADVYGRRAALETVAYTFIATVCFLVIGLSVVQIVGGPQTPVAGALNDIFAFLPRLMFGGLVAFIVAQTLDVYIFHKIKEKTKGRFLFLRNNASTAISQFVDTVIVWFVAFYGIVENIWAIIFASYAVKLITAVIDTPFVYIGRKVNPEYNPK